MSRELDIATRNHVLQVTCVQLALVSPSLALQAGTVKVKAKARRSPKNVQKASSAQLGQKFLDLVMSAKHVQRSRLVPLLVA